MPEHEFIIDALFVHQFNEPFAQAQYAERFIFLPAARLNGKEHIAFCALFGRQGALGTVTGKIRFAEFDRNDLSVFDEAAEFRKIDEIVRLGHDEHIDQRKDCEHEEHKRPQRKARTVIVVVFFLFIIVIVRPCKFKKIVRIVFIVVFFIVDFVAHDSPIHKNIETLNRYFLKYKHFSRFSRVIFSRIR